MIITVTSDIDPTKAYAVEIRDDGRNTCTCTGFVTKRNKLGGLKAVGDPQTYCKHIRRELRNTHFVPEEAVPSASSQVQSTPAVINRDAVALRRKKLDWKQS